MSSVKITNLSIAYGDVKILDNLSLDIESGEFFFLLGPSGCGKTTLLRAIAGLGQKPQKGTIHIGETDVTDLPAWRRTAPMVFQSYALWPHMTVLKNVTYGLVQNGMKEEKANSKAMDVLARVQMADFAKRRPNELSGGQQQRIALARALVLDPSLILLDEPLSNLDASLRIEMRYELKRIHEQLGLTMIYVTHDQEEAMSMSSRIALLNAGTVAQCGTPDDLYSRPDTLFAASFMGRINTMEGEITSSQNNLHIISTKVGTFKSTYPGNFDTGNAVILAFRPHDIVSAGSQNSFKAQVESEFFYGSHREYVIQSDGGTFKMTSSSIVNSTEFGIDESKLMVFHDELH
ncbi:ABC transporter ATP-binding protein [Myxococcota bacterium]|nr:ABC transporter ATP-binding protein [Myxococcota bacterium]MBU1380760.1 ABC transporter ATP-binding protein [Myxococcota bacterium]MBU1497097.1 ABC transporter ATP-binding protein [Myxococcota bacterium]